MEGVLYSERDDNAEAYEEEDECMKKKAVIKWIAMCLCSVLLAGCGNAGKVNTGGVNTGSKVEEASSTQNEEVDDSGKVNQELAAVETEGMYEKAAYLADMVYETKGSVNTMVSPLSLNLALGLLAEGAKGETGEELFTYLEAEDYGEFAEQYMEYAKGLNSDSAACTFPTQYRIAYEIANSVWVKDDRKLVKDYEKKAEKYYDAKVQAVSFEKADLPKTVKQINDWCNEKTHELIPEVIKEESISEDAAAILINSLYFESPWREEWRKIPHSFTDFEGAITEQEMLCDTLDIYYENEQATGFAKEYQNGMYFVGILPKETGEFALSDLDVESLMASESTAYDVDALMPKLNFETTAENIVEVLKAQGVETVFDKEQSDLTGLMEMEADEVGYVSDIIQKTKIELDENGTKAAAVTAIMVDMCTTAMPVERERKQVYLDRPFAFMIYDEAQNQIVFMGKVVQP